MGNDIYRDLFMVTELILYHTDGIFYDTVFISGMLAPTLLSMGYPTKVTPLLYPPPQISSSI